MKLKYLGTAAAEGIPAIFCHCETCRHARIHKGKEIRTRCQALIDNEILIDLGPDTYLHLLKYDLDITELEHCLITHVHSDHLLMEQLLFRNSGYGVLRKGTKPLTVYGSKDILDILQAEDKSAIAKSEKIQFRELTGYQPVQIGNYKVTAFPATHGSPHPFFYSIEKNDKAILYAHDTDIFPDGVWDYLIENKIHFNLVSMDCTEGFEEVNYVGHMNFEKNLSLREQMLKSKIADEKTMFVANHFSHNGHASYAEASDFAAKHDMIIAYDGMEIEI